jgi:hypothetical protein
MHSRGVEKNQLGVRIISDAGYFISRRLRLIGNNGYFIADDLVEKSRFPGVGTSDDAYES